MVITKIGTEDKPISEQTTTISEQTLGQLLETAGAEKPVATEAKEPVAEDGETKTEPEAPKTLTEEEVQERILSQANSIAAKSVQSLQKANEALTKKLADMETAATKRQRETDRAKRAGAELETWGDTPEVREFQKTRDANEEFYDKVSAAYESETAKWQKTNNENINLRLFLKYNLPNGEDILKQLDDFTKELGEGSEAERELKALRASLAAKEPPKKAPKLDSGRLSAPGGMDWSKLSGEELLCQAVEEDRKKGK